MTNLTITVDEKVLKSARIMALQEGTSVNAILREHLERYVGKNQQYKQATQNILKIARASKACSHSKRWTRDELYLSEDMQDGYKLGQLEIVNPFK